MGQKRHENKKTDGPNKQKPVGVGEQELQSLIFSAQSSLNWKKTTYVRFIKKKQISE